MSPSSRRDSAIPRIAVSGASGRVATTLINLLANDPVNLVALTRQTSKTVFPSTVTVATVDFERTATLTDALVGSDQLFLAHGTSERQVEHEIALIDAAVAAGVRHIVKLSVMGPATLLNPFAWHMRIEAHLASQPVAATLLRPTTFADVLKRAGPKVANDTWAGAAGQGAVNLIDARDVAEVARVALLQRPADHAQRAYHLTGPRAWSMPEIAQALSRLLERPVTYHQRPAAEHRAALIAEGASVMVADLLLGLDLLFCESALAESTCTVEQLTGKPPRTLTAWLTENLALFR